MDKDKITITSNPQTLEVNWARKTYTTSKSIRDAYPLRRCWKCHLLFEIGDEVTVVNTPEGNKLVHPKCFQGDSNNEDV